ncbi:hypothetical protein Droror1_Dr00025877 [Drosera rotundifolia]
MALSKMCAPKFEGGLDFREFRSFNDPLLAKNLWRILQQPHSRALAVPALKVKYFRTSTVLTAGLCRRPSYLWRSLMDARSLLSLHLQQNIGSGEKTLIYEDPWIPSLPYDLIPPVVSISSLDATVNSLLDAEKRNWNKELILQLFPNSIASAIFNIPVEISRGDYWRSWSLSTNGCYSVKSAYKKLRKLISFALMRIATSHPPDVPSWNRQWKLDVHPANLRIRMFPWRACHDCLLSRTNLVSRGMVIPIHCPMCHNCPETPSHVLASCEKPKEVWKHSGNSMDLQLAVDNFRGRI